MTTRTPDHTARADDAPVISRFQRWLHTGDFTRADLGIYRLVYGIVAVFCIPDLQWVSALPQGFFHPYVGPFRFLFNDFQSSTTLGIIEFALTVSAISLLVGFYTKVSSFVYSFLLVLGSGFVFSTGMQDHEILMTIVPMLLAFAGWGDRFSVDAALRARRGEAPAGHWAMQWPLRLMAVTVGLGYITATYPKVIGGWLRLDTHVTQSVMFRQVHVHERTHYLGEFFLQFHNPVFWEAFDIFTIIFEGGMIIAVLSWRWARIWFSIAAVFHLGVLAMMEIPFEANIITYAFAILWVRTLTNLGVPVQTLAKRTLPSWMVSVPTAAAVVAALGTFRWCWQFAGYSRPHETLAIVVTIGGLCGAAYLLWTAIRFTPFGLKHPVFFQRSATGQSSLAR